VEGPRELPEGWGWAKLGDVAQYINGRAFKPVEWEDSGRPIIRIQNLTGSTREIHYYSKAIEGKYLVKLGDLLVSWSATLDAFIWNRPEGVLNQHIFKVLPYIDKRFLYYAFKFVLRSLKEQVHGTGMQHITRGPFLASLLPVPPIEEQRRIIAKIETLFEKSRAAREALDRVPVLMKRFRQAVLAEAFTGELTEREEGDDPAEKLLERIRRHQEQGRKKHRSRTSSNTVEAPWELVDGWTWTHIGELTESTFYGPRFAKEDYRAEGVITIRTTDMDDRGNIVLKDPPRIQLDPQQIEHVGLQEGDILVTRSGSIGKCAIFEGISEPAVPSAYVIRFRLSRESVYPRYVLLYLLSQYGQMLLGQCATAVTQSNVNAQKVRGFPIPLAPIHEQRRIVSHIESLFSHASAVEAMARVARQRLDRLDQAVLAKAFRGELVEQDLNDEPASVLLERIRHEREKSAKDGRPKSNRRRRTT
jgi:type I restriction enzyme S subunit